MKYTFQLVIWQMQNRQKQMNEKQWFLLKSLHVFIPLAKTTDQNLFTLQHCPQHPLKLPACISTYLYSWKQEDTPTAKHSLPITQCNVLTKRQADRQNELSLKWLQSTNWSNSHPNNISIFQLSRFYLPNLDVGEIVLNCDMNINNCLEGRFTTTKWPWTHWNRHSWSTDYASLCLKVKKGAYYPSL